jgi:hypothetical protein
MTLYEFKLLNEKDQLQVLIDRGGYLGEYVKEASVCYLFQIDGFYFEPVGQHWNQTSFRTFSFTGGLLPYLETIDISGILKQML